jgi:ribosomal protein S18 acetylase RimI-like enzyme
LNNLIIRKARLEDHDTLLDLEQKVVEAERPYNPIIKPKNAIYYDLKTLLTDPLSHLLIVEHEEKVIGTGYAQIKTSKDSLKHDKHAYLGFMYVAPHCRGLGINKLIMEKLIDWSKQQNIFDLDLDVYAENNAAIKAYEKVGFVKSLVEMQINLERE